MMKSMTGYGTATVQTASGRSYMLEVKSVNHRYCDVHAKVPGKLAFIEQDVKRLVKERFERGRFDVYLSLDEFGRESRKITFDQDLAAAYLEQLRELAAHLQLEPQIDLLSLTRMPEVIKVESAELDEAEARSAVEDVLRLALEHLEQMRTHEGNALTQDVLGYLDQIARIAADIARVAEQTPTLYKAALEERIRRLTENIVEIDEERLAQEVAIFADRIDISEEITRLNGHIEHFKHLMANEEAVGRKLDFLVQEMNREINTIGSKANNVDIARLVVDVKSILEKIREQIQNIE